MMRRLQSLVVALLMLSLAGCESALLRDSRSSTPVRQTAGDPLDAGGQQRLGRELASRRLAQTPLLDDPALQEFVNRLGLWLALNSEQPRLAWRFGVTDSDRLQTFAAPGGVVLVSRGLLQLLETEDEVAAVLAQQIAQVGAGHAVEAIRRRAEGTTLNRTLAALGAAPGQGELLTVAEAIYAEGLPATDVFAADRAGMELATRSGYEPYALLSVLAMLEQINAADPRARSLLAGLPPAADRLAKLEAPAAALQRQPSLLRDSQRWPQLRAPLLQQAGR